MKKDLGHTIEVGIINYIVSNGGKVVILSHFGKIKSESDFVNNSLYVVYKRLRELVSFDISFCSISIVLCVIVFRLTNIKI